MPSFPVRYAVSDAFAFARLTSRLASLALSSSAARAPITAERVTSTSQNICAARCFSAWNDPMATPNCLRSFRYCTVRSKASDELPSISAAKPARARSSTLSSGSAPPSTRPSTAPAPTRTSFSVTRAALRLSIIDDRARLTPAASAGTMNRVIPSRSSAAPEVRATTISWSATCPSSTNRLAPFSTQPSPSRLAVVSIWLGL